MCFVLGSVYPAQRGIFGTLWWRIACCPRRLLGFATLGGMALALPPTLTHSLAATAALLPLLLLPALSGLVLDALPRWGERRQLHYLRSLTLFNGFLLTMALLLYGTPPWQIAGLVLHGANLVFLFSTLRNYLPWIRQQHQQHCHLALAALTVLSALSLGLPLFS